MRLKTRDNLPEVEADLDALRDRILSVAAPRAINTLQDQAQTAGFREIKQVYDIAPATMDKYTTVKLARAGELEASITVKGRGFPLSTFKPVQNRTGVAVTIKGKRVTIPHAFMVARFGQHVFARGAYGGKGKGVRPTGETFGRFVFGRGRLPINELWTFSPPDCLANPNVKDAMDAKVEESAPKQLKRELSAIARGF